MGALKIAYSNKKITPWGGMKLLKDFMDHLEIIPYLGKITKPDDSEISYLYNKGRLT